MCTSSISSAVYKQCNAEHRAWESPALACILGKVRKMSGFGFWLDHFMDHCIAYLHNSDHNTTPFRFPLLCTICKNKRQCGVLGHPVTWNFSLRGPLFSLTVQDFLECLSQESQQWTQCHGTILSHPSWILLNVYFNICSWDSSWVLPHYFQWWGTLDSIQLQGRDKIHKNTALSQQWWWLIGLL